MGGEKYYIFESFRLGIQHGWCSDWSAPEGDTKADLQI